MLVLEGVSGRAQGAYGGHTERVRAEEQKTEVVEDKLGSLVVVDEPSEEQLEKEGIEISA